MKLAHCIQCGCHDVAACHDEDAGEPCAWLVVDRDAGKGVCSACPDALARWKAGDREFAVPVDPTDQQRADDLARLYGESVFRIPLAH